jgi:integrase
VIGVPLGCCSRREGLVPTKRRERVKGAPGVYRSISGSYEIAYRDSDGRQVFRTLPKGMTKEDAKLARADVISRLGRGEKDRRAPKRFHEYATSVIDAMDYAPNTRWKYEYHLRLHLTRFHKLKLSDIDVDKVAALVAQMKKQKYAGSTIGGALTALSVVMDKAVRNGYAVANPVRQLEKSERPKKNSHERRILNQQEIARLLEHARSYRPLIAFLLFTGVRIGEALGMQWQDIDFAAENIHVRAQRGTRPGAQSAEDSLRTPQDRADARACPCDA